jgi:hypothetical protein
MTLWFDRKVGEFVSEASENGEPGTLIFMGNEAMPDWVKTPEEIGGKTLKVLKMQIKECPKCIESNHVKHLELEEGMFVAECRRHGFIWYLKR